jgi:hypothetical protein
VGDERVKLIQTPIRLEYNYTPGAARSRFLRGLARGKVLGERCPVCRKVYVSPPGSCPRDGAPMGDDVVELAHAGTITTFCVVNLPFAGQNVEIPYVTAHILLDGADIPMYHLIQEVPAAEVRMGMRVEAVWMPEGEREPTLNAIRYFRPTGEPDAPIDDVLRRLHSA